jgi:choline dehydrogenase-like flavoprotein
MRLSVAFVAHPLVGPSLAAQQADSRKFEVVVISAGLAGLAAARELVKQRYDVVVLEARNPTLVDAVASPESVSLIGHAAPSGGSPDACKRLSRLRKHDESALTLGYQGPRSAAGCIC